MPWSLQRIDRQESFDEYVKYGELRKTKREPDAQEAAALADLEIRITALNEQMETLGDEDGDEDAF